MKSFKGYFCCNILFTTGQSTLITAQTRTISGQKTPEFAHDRHQLVFPAEGAFNVRNNFGCWTVPPGCAAWIPSGVRHGIEPLAAARAQTLYISPSHARRAWKTCAVLHVTPLFQALIDHICRLEVLRNDNPASKRMAMVLIDQLAIQRQLPLFVPQMRTAVTQKIVAMTLSDPADTPRIRDLATAAGVSSRTIERAFVADASMTIGEWRQRMRIAHAIALLANGGDVKDVALEVGYETPSAFVAAFKKTVGMTPGKIR